MMRLHLTLDPTNRVHRTVRSSGTRLDSCIVVLRLSDHNCRTGSRDCFRRAHFPSRDPNSFRDRNGLRSHIVLIPNRGPIRNGVDNRARILNPSAGYTVRSIANHGHNRDRHILMACEISFLTLVRYCLMLSAPFHKRVF